jgi:hypothetical protein
MDDDALVALGLSTQPLSLVCQRHSFPDRYLIKPNASTLYAAWMYETACALRIEETIDLLVPYNQYFYQFRPRLRLEVVSSKMDDLIVADGSLKGAFFH